MEDVNGNACHQRRHRTAAPLLGQARPPLRPADAVLRPGPVRRHPHLDLRAGHRRRLGGRGRYRLEPRTVPRWGPADRRRLQPRHAGARPRPRPRVPDPAPRAIQARHRRAAGGPQAGHHTVSEQTPAPLRALVVDDEPPLVRLVTSYLERDGFQVQAAGDGQQAAELARTFKPEVIVLDLMLPRVDGIEACRQIRTFSAAYIVMLTARAEEVDKLIGLGLGVGADDYLTKPFSPRELVARIRAMLRRPRAAPPTGQPPAPARRV